MFLQATGPYDLFIILFTKTYDKNQNLQADFMGTHWTPHQSQPNLMYI